LKPLISLEMHFQAFQGVKRTNKLFFKTNDVFLMKLANTYNDLCHQLTGRIASGQAPPSSAAPQPIQRNGLFKLDVDDDIWQDVGLDDEYDDRIPWWLGDEGVHSGIQALLLHDWCCKEELRLREEHCNLQQWFMEEWVCVKAARGALGEHSVISVIRCQKVLMILLSP
jgi:hypothetical protein